MPLEKLLEVVRDTETGNIKYKLLKENVSTISWLGVLEILKAKIVAKDPEFRKPLDQLPMNMEEPNLETMGDDIRKMMLQKKKKEGWFSKFRPSQKQITQDSNFDSTIQRGSDDEE